MEYLHNNEKEVRAYFDNLDDVQMIEYHNAYCDRSNYEDQIYKNDEDFLNENFSDIMEAVKAVCHGDFDLTDNYVRFDGLANLQTTDNPIDFIEVDVLIQDAMENPEEYGIEFINPNDMDDEELFEYLKENDCSGDIAITDDYSEEEWPRERLEEIGCNNDLI